MSLETKLQIFCDQHNLSGSKGGLSVMLVVSRAARKRGLPLERDQFLTSKKGQVKGLGLAAVQHILLDHGIVKTLAKEGGRTSRGSMANMENYLALLNGLHASGDVDLEAVERFWVRKVERFFAGKPLRLKLDRAKSMGALLRDLIEQVAVRQKQSTGTMMVGAVMQHLVGAKLEVLMPDLELHHEGFAVADAPTKRSGDFHLGDSTVHVTQAPTPSLMEKCAENLAQGLRPLIVTSKEGVVAAGLHAESLTIQDRVEVLEIVSFLTTNVFEWSRFDSANRKSSLERLLERYNAIVQQCETDPSLLIELV